MQFSGHPSYSVRFIESLLLIGTVDNALCTTDSEINETSLAIRSIIAQ